MTGSSSAQLSIAPFSADWTLGSDQYVPSPPNITPASPNGHIRSLARPPRIRSAAFAAPSLVRKSRPCRHHRPPRDETACGARFGARPLADPSTVAVLLIRLATPAPTSPR